MNIFLADASADGLSVLSLNQDANLYCAFVCLMTDCHNFVLPYNKILIHKLIHIFSNMFIELNYAAVCHSSLRY